MPYTLAIDQSTSATKVLLFDDKDTLTAQFAVEHEQYYPAPGWVEHDPVEIVRNLYAGIRELLFSANIQAEEIGSVALTNQRETVVVWNKETGEPVYNAVVWQCQRGAALCNSLRQAGHNDMVKDKTGLMVDPYFSASGVSWILDHVPGAREQANQGLLLMGTMDTWLIWHLTNRRVHATDVTNASRTLLFNINTLEWDDDLLALFNIPRSLMPEVRPCDVNYGETDLNELLETPIPIAGVLGDSHGALVGQLCVEPAMGKATVGTGSSVMVNIGLEPLMPTAGLVTSVGFAALGEVYYAFEGNIHCTGDTLQWLTHDLGLLADPSESEVLATAIPDNQGVYLVPAFAGLGAPWWNNEARAILCGMDRGTNKRHIARAALEAIAYQIKDLVDVMVTSAGLSLKELRVDGGAVRNDFLLKFMADMLNVPVRRSAIKEASAYGAVLMNALALGRRQNLLTLETLTPGRALVKPTMKASDRERNHAGWRKAISLINP